MNECEPFTHVIEARSPQVLNAPILAPADPAPPIVVMPLTPNVGKLLMDVVSASEPGKPNVLMSKPSAPNTPIATIREKPVWNSATSLKLNTAIVDKIA